MEPLHSYNLLLLLLSLPVFTHSLTPTDTVIVIVTVTDDTRLFDYGFPLILSLKLYVAPLMTVWYRAVVRTHTRLVVLSTSEEDNTNIYQSTIPRPPGARKYHSYDIVVR